MTVEKLIEALHAEAERRKILGHHAAAHELHTKAGDVSRISSALEASKQIRSKTGR